MYLTNGASLSGLTLTWGTAPTGGGGAVGGTLNNCTLTGNSVIASRSDGGGAGVSGGGAACCTLNNCMLSVNSASSILTLALFNSFGGPLAQGGGAYSCRLNNCTLTGNTASATSMFPRSVSSLEANAQGGGAARCTLNNCTLSGNSAGATLAYPPGDSPLGANAQGGGADHSTLNNCTLSGNSTSATTFGNSYRVGAYAKGGGAYNCMLNNSTLSGNSASSSNSYSYYSKVALGGGAYNCTLNNCTLVCNWANAAADFPGSLASGGGAYDCGLNNCISFGNYVYGFGCEDCYSPGLLFGNNWFGDPLFVGGSLRLQSNSPCINAGDNSYVTNATDLDGNPRIVGGTVDIGAYEFQSPASMISYAWLQKYVLPINTSTDTADPDGDGVNNYREWLAHSDPTNPFSFPPLLTLIPYGANVVLTWPTNALGFTLQSTTNLVSPAGWSTNSPAPVVIGGQNVIINPISDPQQFYRLSQ